MNFTIYFSKKNVLHQGTNTHYPIIFQNNKDQEKLKELLKSRDCIFSHVKDKSGLKNIDGQSTKFIKSNCLFMDIDEGTTIEEIREKLKNVKYIIYTSKSHQKEKNNKICDRFHVILPTNKNITDDSIYKSLIKHVKIIIETFLAPVV